MQKKFPKYFLYRIPKIYETYVKTCTDIGPKLKMHESENYATTTDFFLYDMEKIAKLEDCCRFGLGPMLSEI